VIPVVESDTEEDYEELYNLILDFIEEFDI